MLSLSEQFKPTAMLAHLTDLAHGAHGPLVLGVVLGPVERALLECRTTVDRRV